MDLKDSNEITSIIISSKNGTWGTIIEKGLSDLPKSGISTFGQMQFLEKISYDPV